MLFILLSFVFSSLLMYATMFSYNQMFYFPVIIIYSVVNSYIVNKTLKCMEAQPPEIEQHKVETEGLRKKRPGVPVTDRYQGSRSQTDIRGLYIRGASEVSSLEQEVGVVALLLLPHTPSRTFWSVHEARATALHMLGEVLWHLVQFATVTSTEECDP